MPDAALNDKLIIQTPQTYQYHATVGMFLLTTELHVRFLSFCELHRMMLTAIRKSNTTKLLLQYSTEWFVYLWNSIPTY